MSNPVNAYLGTWVPVYQLKDMSINTRPPVGQYLNQISVILANISAEYLPTYRSSDGQYIGRVSVDMSAKCPSTRGLIYRQTDAFSTQDLNGFSTIS